MLVIGDDADLGSRKADSPDTARRDGQGEHGHTLSLARGEQHVELSWVGGLAQRTSLLDEGIGRLSHGGDDHDHTVCLCARYDDLGDALEMRDAGEAAPAKFNHDDRRSG
jgi:hypothetical protein